MPSLGQNAQQNYFECLKAGGIYEPSSVVVKVRATPLHSGARAADHTELLQKIAKEIQAESIRHAFPQSNMSGARNANRSALNDFYQVELHSGEDLWRAIDQLSQMEELEYAEPVYIHEVLYVPSDPQASAVSGLQTHLNLINAYDAWQVEKGDPAVVVGIVDTGADMAHDDLQNIAINHSDPVNGVDDDADGYVDNYRGWDMANGDNDATADGDGHGTQVTGMSSATTDNGLGIAGTGFHCSFLPVKISDSATKRLRNEYAGIVYAVDHGAKVINLSWGGANNCSKLGQDIINYAVLDNDVVVVAAAGNTPQQLNFFPASYQNVLSVGATDLSDKKATWATWSPYIDLVAPANQVYTTNNSNGYGYTLGSSFAAPMVAGAAALVRSRFPHYSALQVMEQVRVTADDIYGIGGNDRYFGALGKGRLNMQRAVSDTITPSVRMTRFSYAGPHKHARLLFAGDTCHVKADFTNYLRQARNFTARLSTEDARVAVIQDVFHSGQIGTMQTVDNNNAPFKVIIHEDRDHDRPIVFRLDYTAEGYSDFQYFEFVLTPDHFELTIDSLAITVASDGDLGYDDNCEVKGEGLIFKNQRLASYMGIMFATGADRVADNIINDFYYGTKDRDFIKEERIALFCNSAADWDARSAFKESAAQSNKLDLWIEQKVLGWDDESFFVVEYRLVNTGDSPISNLHAGMYADWNIGDYRSNIADWNAGELIGYTTSRNTAGTYAGIGLLTTGLTPAHTSIDLGNYHGNQPDVEQMFYDQQKYEMISREGILAQAGTAGAGNDVAQLTGYGGLAIAPKDAVKIAFVILIGDQRADISNALANAKLRYADYLANPPVEEIFYACTGGRATINPTAAQTFELYSDPYLSDHIFTGESYETPPMAGAQIYYMRTVNNGYYSDTRALIAQPADAISAFQLPQDTLMLEVGEEVFVPFTDRSTRASEWQWDFGNGYYSTQQHPKSPFDKPGNYAISLIVRNEWGCTDSSGQMLVVAHYPPAPSVVLSGLRCAGETVELRDASNNTVRVYTDHILSDRIFEGAVFSAGPLRSDTLYFVTSVQQGFESKAVAVPVAVENVDGSFLWQIDTTAQTKHVVRLISHDQDNRVLRWTINGIAAGTEKETLFNYLPASPITVRLDVASSSGCAASSEQRIVPAISHMPQTNVTIACEGERVLLRPGGGRVFCFYEDASQDRLVHMGREYAVTAGTSDQTFYVTGIDNLAESEPATMPLLISRPMPGFTLSDEQLVYGKTNTATATNTGSGHRTMYWRIGDEVIENAHSINLQFDELGQYAVEQVMEDSLGCVAAITQYVQVQLITSLGNASGASEVMVYPNPAGQIIYFNNLGSTIEPITYYITNAEGTLMSSGVLDQAGTIAVQVGHLSQGIYIIRLFGKDQLYFGKFVKL
jgi:hypothetical protein